MKITEVMVLPSNNKKAKILFKQLKAGIRKWDDLNEEELQLMLRHYPSLFPCEYFENGVQCGYPSYAIIIAEKDDKVNKICVCKKHYAKLSLSLLHKGYKVYWVKRYETNVSH